MGLGHLPVERLDPDGRWAHQPVRRIHFSDIEPAWLRALAKRWARWRLGSATKSPAGVERTNGVLRRLCRWADTAGALLASPGALTRELLEHFRPEGWPGESHTERDGCAATTASTEINGGAREPNRGYASLVRHVKHMLWGPALLGSMLAAPATAEGDLGRLVVKAYWVNTPGLRPGNLEGSYRYLTIKRDGNVVVRRRYGHATTKTVFSRRLPPGRYRVVTYVRGCVGTCRTLDVPVRKCARYFRVRSGQRTTVHVVDKSGYTTCPALGAPTEDPALDLRPQSVYEHRR